MFYFLGNILAASCVAVATTARSELWLERWAFYNVATLFLAFVSLDFHGRAPVKTLCWEVSLRRQSNVWSFLIGVGVVLSAMGAAWITFTLGGRILSQLLPENGTAAFALLVVLVIVAWIETYYWVLRMTTRAMARRASQAQFSGREKV